MNKSVSLFKEFIKYHTPSFLLSRNQDGSVFCIDQACDYCKVYNMCTNNNISPILSKIDIINLKKEHPEAFL